MQKLSLQCLYHANSCTQGFRSLEASWDSPIGATDGGLQLRGSFQCGSRGCEVQRVQRAPRLRGVQGQAHVLHAAEAQFGIARLHCLRQQLLALLLHDMLEVFVLAASGTCGASRGWLGPVLLGSISTKAA